MVRSLSQRGLSLPLILLSGLILALCISLTALVVVHMTEQWSPTFRNASRHLERGRYKEALAVAQRLPLSSQDGSVELLMGKIWLAKAYERQRLERWKSYAMDSTDYFTGDEAEQALLSLRAAVAREPNNGQAHLFLGVLYMEKGWLGEAEVELMEALRSEPDNATVRINLAALYVALQRYEDAELELQQAYELQPHNPDVAKNLAFLFRYYLNDPRLAMLWSNRYLNLQKERDPDRSVLRQDFDEMLKRYPEFTPDEDQRWRRGEADFRSKR
jgi:tetratricopeptide (TPR) repeat protein